MTPTLKNRNRKRRYLYGFLIVQLVLTVVVFPLLFMYIESGAFLGSSGDRQYLSYVDWLYVSVNIATGVGFGQISLVTQAGKVAATVLSILGMITIAVLVALLLDWMTPARPGHA